MGNLVLVFARTPVLGTVKTRLAKKIGAEKTLWVYKQLLKKTESVLQNTKVDSIVFYSGKSVKDFGIHFMKYKKLKQRGEDLGQRMLSAFQWGFEKGYNNIIIIGSDLWELDTNTIDGAFDYLKTHDVVIGPATDGGYYLLGMTKLIPEVFKNKKWGSSSIAAETLYDLGAYKISMTNEKTDLDTYRDLEVQQDLFKEYKRVFDI
jgi:rSAM/selenodomain-associated transferase 1